MYRVVFSRRINCVSSPSTRANVQVGRRVCVGKRHEAARLGAAVGRPGAGRAGGEGQGQANQAGNREGIPWHNGGGAPQGEPSQSIC